MWALLSIAAAVLAAGSLPAYGEIEQRVVDIPTRDGVSQRIMVLAPDKPRAAVILFAGGHGGLQISSTGSFGWGGGNFLVRTRQLFAEQGLLTAVIDVPSDRQRPPFLSGVRQKPEHVHDVRAVIAWLRSQARVPVWLVGTSRGTQSAGHVATALAGSPEGPDGLVLTATILTDNKSTPVTDMALEKLTIPVLVVHHEQDGCSKCPFARTAELLTKLGGAKRKELRAFRGGRDEGDPCEARAHHGFNGLEREVVGRIAAWMLAP
jgi:dienelactone hydrolase